jgi:response regulator RpfG family c-di-GMP phosphodiesterase
MEILDVIELARTMGRNFIWHTVNERRVTYPIQILDLRSEGDQSLIAIENKSTDFKMGETVYLRMDSRDAAFKSVIQQINDIEIVLTFPKEALVSDFRKLHRTPFSVGDHKTVRIRHLQNGKEKISDLLCLDVHEAGMALFMVTTEGDHFAIESSFSVEALGDQPLDQPKQALVVSKVEYLVKNSVSHIQGYRFGIELSDVIAKPVLDQFSIRTSLFELNNEELVRDTIFRNKVHQNMKETLAKLSKHKLLKKFFAHLDFDRRDNDYIKIHIKLLCEILCGLGTRLGWVTEKTMDKLVYVAFMHDVALLQYPELAKIKSKRQLESIPDLSDDDIKRYLSAPMHSAELARLDPESYPDVVKILLQQRELPDGSGFPHALTGTQLVPLSSLFIFSHYLVDYMINEPDWTISDFIKSHQWILKGTYFTKITQLLKAQI